MEIIKPSVSLLALVFALFSPLLVAVDRASYQEFRQGYRQRDHFISRCGESRKVGRRTFVMVNVQRASLSWRFIDDGARGRGDRSNIFNPNYNAAGTAYGLHAGYGSVCSVDFVSGYAQGTIVRARTGAANSF